MDTTDHILSELEETILQSVSIDVIRFAIDMAYRHGVSIGFALRDRLSEPIRWSRDEGVSDFSRLRASWYWQRGRLKVSVYSPLDGEFRFSDVDLTALSGKECARFMYYDRRNEFYVIDECSTLLREPVTANLLVQIVESNLAKFLRDLKFSNHFGLCQSGLCHEQNVIQILRHKVGNLWLCENCEDRFMLNEPLPTQPDETPKEKTEREKMTASLRFEILARDSFTCRACGRSPRKGDDIKLHVDHIKPIHHGGLTVAGNLQVLCQDCNLGKSAKWTRQIELLFQ